MKTKFLLLILLFVSLQSLADNSNQDFWAKKWLKSFASHEANSNDYQANINCHNWRYENRQLLHEAAHEYLVNLEIQNVLYTDPELEDYLYQLVYKIHPKAFPSQQKIHLNVKIIRSLIPEAFSFTNGTILISTGMLTMIHSEDELVAILAREIAHLTLDHNIKTYTALQTKRTIAAIVGTGAYIASSINSLNKGDNYFEADYLGSVIGAGSELLSYGILSALGVGYNRSRIYKADEIAQEWMAKNQYNPYALVQVIRRLQFFETRYRGTNLALSENRFFLRNRFENILENKKYKLSPHNVKLMPTDVNYDTQISECLKTNSKLLVADEVYSEAIPYLDRAIQSNWTSGETYLLKAIALRHTKYSKEANLEILSLLDQANENAVAELPWIWSEKGLIHLRLKENEEALNAFSEFDQFYKDVQTETPIWAQKMIVKLTQRIK